MSDDDSTSDAAGRIRELEDRIDELEEQVAAHQRAIEHLSSETAKPASDSISILRECAVCDDGWVLRDGDRLVCDSCSYVAHL